jgi:hypothetical protein
MSEQTSSNFVGSDDWIRLNFKWYLFTLLGSIVKEDVCLRLKNELESILFAMVSDTSPSASGGDSSSGSLENEVVNIDDYIEKVNNTNGNGNNAENQAGNKFDTMTTPRVKKSSKKNSHKNSLSSNSSLTSTIQYYNLLQQSNAYSDFREDFNSHFVSEFKRTDCFRAWQEANRLSLEKSLFHYSSENLMRPASSETLNLTNWNSRFQLVYGQLQEVDQQRLSHPFNGQLGVNDIKLRFNFLFSNTESGRKLNKAIEEGGKFVNTTGKAVGSVITSAKSTFSSLLSNWSSPSGSSSTPAKSKSNTKM